MQINLLDPHAYANGQPIDQMMWLQEHDPVHWHPEPGDGPGFWALTRYADAKAVHSNPKVFSSQPTITVQETFTLGDESHFHLIASDAPRHTQHRRFLGEELAAGEVRKRTEQVRDIVREVIDDVIEKGECDLVWDLAGNLAAYAAADIIGIPRHEGVALYELADRIANSESTIDGDGLQAATDLFQHAASVRSDRMRCPRNDWATRVAEGGLDGFQTDEMQFFIDFMMIFGGAVDTSRNVLAGGMDALFRDPGQWAALVADPGLVPSAVEEMIRWVTPIVYQRRTVTEDTEIGGKTIRTGQKVASFLAAANRDPAVFDDALRFDIYRRPNHHIAFGFGPHFCLGSHLARLELNLMLAEMVRRLPDIRPTAPTVWSREGDADRQVAPIIIGPQSMPVCFGPGKALS
ncbi:cytochrome P450 [Nocardia jiangxiensis]|uniref:cytochrome P450 n=1 Tax=Nocardia jiangxiensis TaxID=282685 RepID=UPI0003144317|nr:cytochrome P450 [Nocardia jiangxiensis]